MEKVLKNLQLLILSIVKQTWTSTGLDKNSDLVKSLEVKLQTNAGLIVYANNYAEFVQKGKKRFTKKIPISSLIEFIKKEKLKTNNINNLAYQIQNSIYKNGIKGKNIINAGENSITKNVEPFINENFFKEILTQLKIK